MKIKAIIFLFLVIMLNNSYSMDMDNDFNDFNNFNNLSIVEKENKIEEKNKEPLIKIFDRKNMVACKKNYDKERFKFNESGMFESMYRFLEHYKYIELKKKQVIEEHGAMRGFKCLVCSRQYDKTPWCHAYEHFGMHGKKIGKNNNIGFYFEDKIANNLDQESIISTKKSRPFISLENLIIAGHVKKVEDKYFCCYCDKNLFEGKLRGHLEGEFLKGKFKNKGHNVDLTKSCDQQDFSKLINVANNSASAFVPLFLVISFNQSKNQQENIQQNGSPDSGNNNIGKEPEDKRRKLD